MAQLARKATDDLCENPSHLCMDCGAEFYTAFNEETIRVYGVCQCGSKTAQPIYEDNLFSQLPIPKNTKPNYFCWRCGKKFNSLFNEETMRRYGCECGSTMVTCMIS